MPATSLFLIYIGYGLFYLNAVASFKLNLAFLLFRENCIEPLLKPAGTELGGLFCYYSFALKIFWLPWLLERRGGSCWVSVGLVMFLLCLVFYVCNPGLLLLICSLKLGSWTYIPYPNWMFCVRLLSSFILTYSLCSAVSSGSSISSSAVP